MVKAIIEPRSYLERPPISWLFSYFGVQHNKDVMQAVRVRVAENKGLNLTSWSAVEAGEEAAVKYFEEWNRRIVETVPKEKLLGKGPSTLAFFASVSPSAMVPPPNCFLCFSRAITYVKSKGSSWAVAPSRTEKRTQKTRV
jgi:hypothetical protein